MDEKNHSSFLELLRLGIGHQERTLLREVDWLSIQAFAEQQGLAAVSLDGIGKLSDEQRPEKKILRQWIGKVMRTEAKYAAQQKVAAKMALMFKANDIRTYVLKGVVVSECYPKPAHRMSVDMDCFLTKEVKDSSTNETAKPSMSGSRDQGHKGDDRDAWTLGNDLIKSHGFKVDDVHYKHSTFHLPVLTVENHRYMVPFRGNRRLKKMEKLLQSWILEDTESQRFEGTWLYRPPVMVSALFLIEHAYTHFLHEGLTWRLVLDWMMFSKKHQDDVNWQELDVLIDEFGFRIFYVAFLKMGKYLLGEISENELTMSEKKMLADIWAPLDVHETLSFKGKVALAGNTWRARWKYRLFTDMSWLTALWIQSKGVLFDRHPKLN